MANENFMKKVKTPEFRLSFPKLEKAESIMGSKELWFSMQMLFDKSQDPAWITDVLKELYKQKWGDAKRPSTFKSPWRDGDTKAEESDAAVYASKFFMSAKAGEKDKILLLDGQKNELSPRDFYAGCYCRAILDVKTYDNQYGKGFNVWIRGIQFIKDGESLGGSSGGAKSDDFDVVQGSKAKNEIAEDDF